MRENPRLRTHYISIYQGDYEDGNAIGKDDDDYYDSDDEDYVDGADEEEIDESDPFYQQAIKLKRQEEAEKAQRKKWLQNARSPVRTSIIDSRGRSYGRGSRKTSVARVWIQPGLGEVVVNRKTLLEYFPNMRNRKAVLMPLIATETSGKFDLQCIVEGGGMTGQADAIKLGVARALNNYNPDLYRPPMKRLGLLTRDRRRVERKKPGLVKARKGPQWVRR